MTITDKQCNECTCTSCKQYSKCTSMPSFKAINCKPYITESYGDRVCGHTKGKGALYGGRETGFLYRHLEGVDKGHLGIECHRRISNIPCWDSHSISKGCSPKSTKLYYWRRHRNSYTKECNLFHFHPLPSSKEEWSDETSDQPETVESLDRGSSFQDGGNSYPSGSAPPRGLDSTSGLEGCLLHHPHPPGPPAVPEVHGGRDLLPVHLPTIWPVLCPWTFTKVMKPLMTLLRSWGIGIIIYIDDILILADSKEEATQHLEVLVSLLEALGFIINQEKSLLSPVQEIEFSGLMVDSLCILLARNRVRFARRQLSVHLQGCNCNQMLPLGPEAQEEFSWWKHHLTQWNRRTSLRRSVQIVIQSDASLSGWEQCATG